MKRTDSDLARERIERDAIVRVLCEKLRGPSDRALDAGGRTARRPAALARPVARALGIRRASEEFDVRARWTPRRARRTAEDPRGAHRVHEAPVETAIALLHRAPGGRLVRDCSQVHGPKTTMWTGRSYPRLAVKL